MSVRRLLLSVAAAMALAGCGASRGEVPPGGGGGSGGSGGGQGSAASCAALDPYEQQSAARTIVEGTMLPGPEASDGVLITPARLEVARYLKGHGPAIVPVQTAISPNGSVAEDGIQPVAEQEWTILSSSRRPPLQTSICGGSHRGFAAPAWRRFRARGVTFDYPARWHTRTYDERGSFSSLIVALSPQPMHLPCRNRLGVHATTITCGQPLRRLAAYSLLATWWADGMPGWSLARVPGRRMLIGGQPAKVRVVRATCSIGADQELTADIAAPGVPSVAYYEFDACMRGPGLGGLTQQVMAVLTSAHFSH